MVNMPYCVLGVVRKRKRWGLIAYLLDVSYLIRFGIGALIGVTFQFSFLIFAKTCFGSLKGCLQKKCLLMLGWLCFVWSIWISGNTFVFAHHEEIDVSRGHEEP